MKRQFLLISLLLFTSLAFSKNPVRAFKELQDGKTDKAFVDFMDLREKDSTSLITNYGLALLHFDKNSKQFNKKLAYKYSEFACKSVISNNWIPNISKLDLKAIDKLQLSPSTIVLLSESIISSIYSDVENKNTITDYKQFISEYANSELVSKAKIRIEDLDWSQTLKIDAIGYYNIFIEKHPNSLRTIDAKNCIYKIAFNQAKRINTQNSYESFIKKYPEAKQVREANVCINILYLNSYLKTFNIIFPNNTDNEDELIDVYTSGRSPIEADAKVKAYTTAIQLVASTFICDTINLSNHNSELYCNLLINSNNIIKGGKEILKVSLNNIGDVIYFYKMSISLSNLISYCEKSGLKNIKRFGDIAKEIKLQHINEEGEFMTICQLVSLLHEKLQYSYNYQIETQYPQSINSGQAYEIPVCVKPIANEIMYSCWQNCLSVLNELNVGNESDISEKYLVRLNMFGMDSFEESVESISSDKIYLRCKKSFYSLKVIENTMSFFQNQFVLNNSNKKWYGWSDTFVPNYNSIYRKHGTKFSNDYREIVELNFLSDQMSGQNIYCGNIELTKDDVDNMGKFSITKPFVYSSDNAGFVLRMPSGKNVLVAPMVVERFSVDSNYINNIVINGYSNWRYPTHDEQVYICRTLGWRGLGGFSKISFKRIGEDFYYDDAFAMVHDL